MYSRAGRTSKIVLVVATIVGLLLMFFIEDRRVALLLFIGITWVEATVFIVAYGFRSNWRETAGGRALFWLATSFWTLMTWIAISVFTRSEFPWHADIRELLYMLFAVGFLNMDLTLLRLQRRYPSEIRWRNPFKKSFANRS